MEPGQAQICAIVYIAGINSQWPWCNCCIKFPAVLASQQLVWPSWLSYPSSSSLIVLMPTIISLWWVINSYHLAWGQLWLRHQCLPKVIVVEWQMELGQMMLMANWIVIDHCGVGVGSTCVMRSWLYLWAHTLYYGLKDVALMAPLHISLLMTAF
jgi:hypothetical protein